MSTVRSDVAANLNLRSAGAVIAANATTAMDFGTPDDINLAAGGYKPGDRVLLCLSAVRAAGTTSSITFTVQDADDSSGSIGTPATATTVGTIPSMSAATAGAVAGIVSVTVKPGRPWIRVNMVHGTAGTDSFSCSCSVIGVPPII